MKRAPNGPLIQFNSMSTSWERASFQLAQVGQRSEFEKFVTRFVATQLDASQQTKVNEARLCVCLGLKSPLWRPSRPVTWMATDSCRPRS